MDNIAFLLRKYVKETGPDPELRKWFGHDPVNWKEFSKRYCLELNKNIEQVSLLKEHMKSGMVTLVYDAKDDEHNEALVLKDWVSH